MTRGIDLNRCLTMAAYSAFVVLSRYLANNPGTPLAQAVAIIRQTNADSAVLDYAGGTTIREIVNADMPGTNCKAALRHVARELIKAANPWWLRLVPYGRDKVKAALEQDQAQCLREAGLFDPFPEPNVIAWWDEIGATVRGAIDTERMLQARKAERWSFEYERRRLMELGIALEPEWVALEDNTLGYDIRSFDWSGDKIVTRLIEVKSSKSDTIFITRNEWQNAAGAAPHYCFHVWKIPEARVLEYSVAAIMPHIPLDRGAGEWREVCVFLEAT